jgi:hypothetical protein
MRGRLIRDYLYELFFVGGISGSFGFCRRKEQEFQRDRRTRDEMCSGADRRGEAKK